MKKEYIINDKTFSSKKSLLNYFKDKKDTFSDTTCLKKNDSEFYNDFITLCKHHNEYDIKFKNNEYWRGSVPNSEGKNLLQNYYERVNNTDEDYTDIDLKIMNLIKMQNNKK